VGIQHDTDVLINELWEDLAFDRWRCWSWFVFTNMAILETKIGRIS